MIPMTEHEMPTLPPAVSATVGARDRAWLGRPSVRRSVLVKTVAAAPLNALQFEAAVPDLFCPSSQALFKLPPFASALCFNASCPSLIAPQLFRLVENFCVVAWSSLIWSWYLQ